jgi:hypothetical protein
MRRVLVWLLIIGWGLGGLAGCSRDTAPVDQGTKKDGNPFQNRFGKDEGVPKAPTVRK